MEVELRRQQGRTLDETSAGKEGVHCNKQGENSLEGWEAGVCGRHHCAELRTTHMYKHQCGIHYPNLKKFLSQLKIGRIIIFLGKIFFFFNR